MRLAICLTLTLLSACGGIKNNCPSWVEPIRAGAGDDLNAAVAAAPVFARSALAHNDAGEALNCW
jgi:hypothetical protein